MLPYLIAGAIGFVVAKIFEEDEAPKYADGGDIDYSNFRTSVIALVNKNKILILQRGSTANWMPNKWSIVGGVIEEGEVPIEAMIRECEEEIGLKPSNVYYDHKIMTNDSGEIYYFVGTLESKDVKLDYENSAYKFISKDEIDNYDFVPYIKEFILSIFSRNTNKPNNHFANGGSVLLAPNGKPSNLTPEQYELVRSQAFISWFGDWEKVETCQFYTYSKLQGKQNNMLLDENGEPQVFYHGSYNYGFTIVDVHGSTEQSLFWLSTSKEFAREFTGYKRFGYKDAQEYYDKDGTEFLTGIYSFFVKTNKIFDIFNYNQVEEVNRELAELVGTKYTHTYEGTNAGGMPYKREVEYESKFDKSHYYNLDINGWRQVEGWESNMWIIGMLKELGYDCITNKEGGVINIGFIGNPNQIKLADEMKDELGKVNEKTNTTFDGNNPDIRFDEGGELADNIFDYLIKEKGFAPLGKGFWGKSNCTIKIDFSNVLYQHYGDNRVWVSPIEYSDYKKAFIILEFHCKDKNKGIGTALLKEIIQGADLFGYTIFIEPTSIKKYRVETDINTNDLKRWYSKYDFKPLNDNYSDNVWLRNPNNPDIRFDGGDVSELNNYLHNIRLDEWYMENEIMDDDNDIEQYKADFGRKGNIVFRVYPDETGNVNSSIYISSIGRGTLDYGVTQSIEGKKDSRGEGAKAIASLFLLYPNVDSFHYEDESYFENEDKSFWKKIGGDSSELFREDFFRYFENKFGYNPDIRYAGGGEIEELKFSNKIESDAMGYDIGDYLYHITPVSNFNTIIKKGFIPKNGISINNKPFENRLYFATSLISAYDLSVNFGSYRDDTEYVIFKIKSDCINDYEQDDLFAHGIYVDYKISNKCILGYVNANDLFNKFDDEDIDNLYY